VISRLVRQNLDQYKALFPHVSAALQMSQAGIHRFNDYGVKGIFTPLCIEIIISDKKLLNPSWA
jgi:hypothetical protein